jgi:hypothetical protein
LKKEIKTLVVAGSSVFFFLLMCVYLLVVVVVFSPVLLLFSAAAESRCVLKEREFETEKRQQSLCGGSDVYIVVVRE